MKDKLQEQLIAARRDQILDAAAAVFAERGFHVTTIKDIARMAGVADGTIYNYFANKTALMIGILERLQATLQPSTPPELAADADLRQTLRDYLSYPLMSLRKDNFELFRIIMSEILVNEELRRLYRERILSGTLALAHPYFATMAATYGLDTARVELVLRAVSGMVFGIILQTVIGDEVLDEAWERLPNLLADLIIDGMKGAAS